MTLRVGLTHPALAQELKLTWMDYLLTMLRNRLRRKQGYDMGVVRWRSPGVVTVVTPAPASCMESLPGCGQTLDAF